MLTLLYICLHNSNWFLTNICFILTTIHVTLESKDHRVLTPEMFLFKLYMPTYHVTNVEKVCLLIIPLSKSDANVNDTSYPRYHAIEITGYAMQSSTLYSAILGKCIKFVYRLCSVCVPGHKALFHFGLFNTRSGTCLAALRPPI